MFEALRKAGLGADQAGVQRKVETAVREYHEAEPPHPRRHRDWHNFADHQIAVQNAADRLRQLAPEEPDCAELLRVADAMANLQAYARSRARRYDSRFARLFSALCQIWIDEGGELVIRDSGPLPDFLSEALAPARSLGHESIKRYLGFERAQRILLRGTGSLRVSAEVLKPVG
jgi:hypothetical protein